MKKSFQRLKRTLALGIMIAIALSILIVPASAESIYAYVSGPDNLAAYADASLSNRIGSLNAYAVVQVVDYSGSAAAVLYNGAGCFVSIGGLTPLVRDDNARVVTESTSVYASPSTSAASIRVPKGMTLYEIRRYGDWAEVANGPYVAYIRTNCLRSASEPEPTKAPETVPSVSIPATVTVSGAKFYVLPDTSSMSIDAPVGTKVTVRAINAGWAYVEVNGVPAYCKLSNLAADSYLDQIATPTPTPTPTPAPTQAPSLDNAIPATVTVSGAKVYVSPDTSSASMDIAVGSKVNVIQINGDWTYLEYNGIYAYCKLSNLAADSYLQTPTPTATPAPTQNTATVIPATVTASRAKVYASPSTSSYSLSVPVGTKVNVVQISGDWAYVERSGAYAFCKVSILTPDSMLPETTATPAPTAEPIPATVIGTDTKLYAAANTNAESVALAVGTKLQVLDISGEWAYVLVNGANGYCKVSNLTPGEIEVTTPAPTQNPSDETAIPAVVIADSVRVYSLPSTTGKYLGTMGKGVEIDVLKVSGGWAYIRRGGAYGFCEVSALMPRDSVPTTEPTVAPTTTPDIGNAIPAVVTADSLAVYQYPSTSSTRFGYLSKGTTLNVIAISDGWAQVEKNGAYGFCQVSGLAPANAEPTKSPLDGYVTEVFNATVIATGARFYASASTSSNNYSVPVGTNVTVGAYNATWAYVQLNGITGFIPVNALSRNSYTPMRSGASGSDVKQLENALLILGYLDSVPGTKYNDYTVSSVKRFQAACGMSATGEADEATLRVLYGGQAPVSSVLSSTYSRGSSGENVSHIQLRLYALGYLSKASSVDGDYGTNTYNAVRIFQASNGLSDSGSADAATLRKLYSTSAVSIPSGKTPGDVSSVPIINPGDQQNNSTKISSSLASTTTSPGSTDASKLEYVIYIGQNQLGKPYIYGANGTSSYDCTGFTCYCFKQLGVKLKRSAVDQGYDNTYPKITSISDLRRGDLVFFNTISDNDLSDHAGIYLGAGYFIHASSGQGKVVISTLASGYYNRVFSWGRRVLQG